MICRLPVDLLPSGLWYPFANESDTPQNGGHFYDRKILPSLFSFWTAAVPWAGPEQDTIGGFTAMLTRQKESRRDEANVTTILFDHEVQLLHDRFRCTPVAPLTEKDYYVRGCTALLDAIGYGMEKMVNIQRHLPEEERAEKVIFVITTDGLENASKRFSYDKIRRMIGREKEQYGWEFLFDRWTTWTP